MRRERWSKANQLFAQLSGVKLRQVLKANSLDDLLKFKVNEGDSGVEQLLEYDSPMRLDEVGGVCQKPNVTN